MEDFRGGAIKAVGSAEQDAKIEIAAGGARRRGSGLKWEGHGKV
jgi:hypothetical protein